VTPEQRRALDEIDRLHQAAPTDLEIVGTPRERYGRVELTVSVRIGAIEIKPGGLPLNERERFDVYIPADYPFRVPAIEVRHARFANFPHVCWTVVLCLYQSSNLEWNPSDGMFGFFDRLKLWLEQAAAGEMDPMEGPLEPPHHHLSDSAVSLVVRADAPVPSGRPWIGWAQLAKHDSYIEIVGWAALANRPAMGECALAIFLQDPLPMEFPSRGRDLFKELLKCDINKDFLMQLLTATAQATTDEQPSYLIVGLPMRRAADGTPRVHIAAWSTESNFASSLRLAHPEFGDSIKLAELRRELYEAVYAVFEHGVIQWCRILDDRSEITTRRDLSSQLAWCKGRKILVLGCGALGSWMAEAMARAGASLIHLVDNGLVKPGLLVRQNFVLADIGRNKAEALAERLRRIAYGIEAQGFSCDAHRFLTEQLKELHQYDAVIDATASNILCMKIERDWSMLGPSIQRYFSAMIDAKASQYIGVVVGDGSREGPWSSYIRLKYELCAEDFRSSLASAFYSEAYRNSLFQPEPGCSDPTFSGSAADVLELATGALNAAISHWPEKGAALALACSNGAEHSKRVRVIRWQIPLSVGVGDYRVLISPKALRQVRGYIRENARVRSNDIETGGLLWGHWHDASRLVSILDASGPPPDSEHRQDHFLCGVEGTAEESAARLKGSHELCGFVGLWHTHPGTAPRQSGEDMVGMSTLVANLGQNRRRAAMLIFGHHRGKPRVGVHLYESLRTGPVEEVQSTIGYADLTDTFV
jgi:ThiF family/Prokaryotic E2 family A/Prokaryotic homologs of the JAB domain